MCVGNEISSCHHPNQPESFETFNRHCAYANGFTIWAEGLRTIQKTSALNSSMSFWSGEAITRSGLTVLYQSSPSVGRHCALGRSDFFFSAVTYWTGAAFSATLVCTATNVSSWG